MPQVLYGTGAPGRFITIADFTVVGTARTIPDLPESVDTICQEVAVFNQSSTVPIRVGYAEGDGEGDVAADRGAFVAPYGVGFFRVRDPARIQLITHGAVAGPVTVSVIVWVSDGKSEED